MPKISVIVPCYNEMSYIDECLDSILAQKNVDLEVIVVDDYSTDGTFEHIEKRSHVDARIQIHRNATNTGSPSAGRNLGINLASGDWIAMVDADDKLLDEDFFARICQNMQNSGAEVGYCGLITENPECNYAPTVFEWERHPRGATNVFDLDKGFWDSTPHMAAFKIYRCEFLQKNKLQFPNIIVEDQPFALLTFFLAKKLYLDPRPVYYYRQFKTIGTHRYFRYDFRNYVGNLASMQWLLQEFAERNLSVAKYQEQLAITFYRLFNVPDIQYEINFLFARKCAVSVAERRDIYDKMRAITLDLWSKFDNSLSYKFFAPEQKDDLQDFLAMDFCEYAATRAGKNDTLRFEIIRGFSSGGETYNLRRSLSHSKNLIIGLRLVEKLGKFPKPIRYPLLLLVLLCKAPIEIMRCYRQKEEFKIPGNVPLDLLIKIDYYKNSHLKNLKK